MILEKYNKNLPYSYIFGAFGTIELLNNNPTYCLEVVVDPSFVSNESFKKIEKCCKDYNITLSIDLKKISKIRDKGNIFVVGVFKKFTNKLNDNNHIVLHKVNDIGKIGTIIRSMAGFGFNNIALVDCDVDLFDEHLIRSTMGAFFKTNIEEYKSFNDYQSKFNRSYYLITNKGNEVSTINSKEKCSIIFSKDKEANIKANNICFKEDIPLENIVNIILFTLYK